MLIKDFKPPREFEYLHLSIFHSALTTENNEALILFCDKHMYIFELMKEERDEGNEAG